MPRLFAARFLLAALPFAGVAGSARAQFELQVSNTAADLRGIANVGGGVA